jgi:hypothetical protein
MEHCKIDGVDTRCSQGERWCKAIKVRYKLLSSICTRRDDTLYNHFM